jgi:hypothetical protein
VVWPLCAQDSKCSTLVPVPRFFPELRKRESRAAVAGQVLVVPTLFRVANCCCRGRPKFRPPSLSPRVFPELRQARLAPSRGGAVQQLAAVLRIKPLRRLRCCALLFADTGRAGARRRPKHRATCCPGKSAHPKMTENQPVKTSVQRY